MTIKFNNYKKLIKIYNLNIIFYKIYYICLEDFKISNNNITNNLNHFTFSVVMAVYNVESFLEDAIESLINQTIGFEEHIELILINDGSKDNSEAIALEYQSKYPNNIRVLSKENGGVASARNLGLKYVTGDYVNFMDSDDKISPESFDSVYKFFLNHKEAVSKFRNSLFL